MLLTSEIEVDFEPVEHRYFRRGVEYLSQSKFVKIFEPQFNPNLVHICAKANGISSTQQQAQWDLKKNIAGDYGTEIHSVIEHSWKGLPFDPKYNCMIDEIRTLVQPSRQVFPEKILYLDQFGIAGTGDLPSERCVTKGQQLLDFFDYKNYLSKGMVLYSSQLKNGKWNHYHDTNRFLGPISHLEYTVYNKCALQLSLYMYMSEIAYHVIPGRMGVLNIDSELHVKNIPVNYMRSEIKEMLEYYSQLKKI